MFQYRSREFDPHIGAIAGHLRAIERELGRVGQRVGQSAGRRTVAHATTAGNQIADAIVPVLNEIIDRFGRGQSGTGVGVATQRRRSINYCPGR